MIQSPARVKIIALEHTFGLSHVNCTTLLTYNLANSFKKKNLTLLRLNGLFVRQIS